jgi:hypothetical protein
MVRTNVLRMAIAVASFGSLVAVVGAGTKWSMAMLTWPW